MTIELWSLLISAAAFLIAGLALGWNIYRDVLLKGRVKVKLKVVKIYSTSDLKPATTKIQLVATNFGPGRVQIMNPFLVNAKTSGKPQYAIVNPTWEDPLNPKPPWWIEEGDSLDLFFKFNEVCFLSEDLIFTGIGLNDYYERSHMAPEKDFLEAMRVWKEKFGKKTDSEK